MLWLKGVWNCLRLLNFSHYLFICLYIINVNDGVFNCMNCWVWVPMLQVLSLIWDTMHKWPCWICKCIFKYSVNEIVSMIESEDDFLLAVIVFNLPSDSECWGKDIGPENECGISDNLSQPTAYFCTYGCSSGQQEFQLTTHILHLPPGQRKKAFCSSWQCTGWNEWGNKMTKCSRCST